MSYVLLWPWVLSVCVFIVLFFIFFLFFFFQAEDGIRDWSVTGVQTCALPISGSNTGNPWTLTFTLRQPTTAIGFDLTDSAETGDVHFITDAGDNVTVVS